MKVSLPQKILSLLLVAAASVPLVQSSASAAVIYREVFPDQNTTGDSTLANIGWSLYRGTTATVITSTTTVASNGVDSGADLLGDAVNSSPSTAVGVVDGGIFGYNFSNGPTPANSTNSFLFNTSEYTVDRVTYSVDSIQLNAYARNSSNAGPISFAVKVGSNWYVGDTVFDTSVSTASTPATFTLTFGTETWKLLNFTSGSTLSVGGTVALPGTGSITEFGWYGLGGDTYADARWDNFTINATVIPEPSTAAALAGLGVLAAVVLRRKRQR